VAKHFRSLTISDIRTETPDCISVSFHIPPEWSDEFRFMAGQNITLRHPVAGEDLRRSYSICTSPHENELRVAIKKVTSGRFSSHAHENFTKGQAIDVMAPTGNFILPLNSSRSRHYVAFAAGSGITPVISLLKSVLREEPRSRFTLVYGNRSRNAVIFREELLALKNDYPQRFQLILVFSREKMDSALFEGRIDASKAELIFQWLAPISPDMEFLLCGPAPMIFSIRDWLTQKGISVKRIHYELFSGPEDPVPVVPEIENDKKPTAVKESEVTIRLDGASAVYRIPMAGPTILDAAIRAGADLPYACRAGVCATCRAKLTEGKVILDHNYSLADEELEEGFILACQAHPDSDKVSIDFDIR